MPRKGNESIAIESLTYIGVPPRAAETYGRLAGVRLAKIALLVAPVYARGNQSMPEAKRRALENVADAWVKIRLVPRVRWKFISQESRQVLVHDDILQEAEKKNEGEIGDTDPLAR